MFLCSLSCQTPAAGTLPRTPIAVLVTTEGSLRSSMTEATRTEGGKETSVLKALQVKFSMKASSCLLCNIILVNIVVVDKKKQVALCLSSLNNGQQRDLVLYPRLCSGLNMVDLAAVEEEETAAGWRSPETTETGRNRRHGTNALNSECVREIIGQQ